MEPDEEEEVDTPDALGPSTYNFFWVAVILVSWWLAWTFSVFYSDWRVNRPPDAPRFMIAHYSKKQIDAMMSSSPGNVVICSDCAIPFETCVSTGTGYWQYKSMTTARRCGDNDR